MNKSIRLCAGLFLVLFSLESYAITVTVQSPSKDVYALGFQLNGSKYGGSGTSYSKSGLPAGKYTFGVRVGGLLFNYKQYGCGSAMLKSDTTAILRYNGHSCTASFSHK